VKAAASPNDPRAHVDLALALLRSKDKPGAQREIDAALKIDPANQTAHYIGARLAIDTDLNAARAHLLAIKTAGGDGYQVQMGLAELAEHAKDKAGTRAGLEAASRFDPQQADAVRGLYDLATEEHRDADALDALRKLAMLEQHDRKLWGAYLQKLVDGKLWDEAKRVGESAMFVDVENPGVHTNYARALSATGAHDKAVFELESALLCDGAPKDMATANALLARELVSLHRNADAKAHLTEALKLDPMCADARDLAIP